MLRLTLVIILGATVAGAQSDATGVVKERMQGMKAMSDATKALGALRAGAIPFNVETMRLAAMEIARHAKEGRELFPKGSLKSPSEALPLLWDEKLAFNNLFDDMAADAALLQEMSDLSAATPVMNRIGEACKECHWRYRIKK